MEPMETKKSGNTGRIVLIVVLCVAIVALVVAIIGFTAGWFSFSSSEPEVVESSSSDVVDAPEGDDESSELVTAPSSSVQDGETDEEGQPFEAKSNGDPTSPAAKAMYAVTDAKPGDSDMSAVVASFDGGELKNGELNIFFWMEYYNFMNTYGQYAEYLGMDANEVLYKQASMGPIDETNEALGFMSWEQYFLSAAMENFKYYKGLELAANAANFVLPESYQSDLQDMIDNLNTAAAEEGYENPEEYLQQSFGSGVTVEDYNAYYTALITSYAYYTEVLKPQCAVDDEAAEAYYDAHTDDFEGQGIDKTSRNDIDVRHILITPEQDLDEDGDGTNDASSDAAWAAAKDKAWEVYNEWEENPVESNFGEMAKKYTADGNGEQGGLYENVYPGQMVPEFNDWCFDKSRRYGDVSVIKTDYGYHVMYFCGECDTMTWLERARDEATESALQELSAAEAAKHPITVDFSKAAICDVVSVHVNKQGSEE